jgi:cell wall-associated NlpC family hydrolase
LQLRIASALTCSLIALGAGSSSALAANSTGGAAPTTSASAPASKPALHLFRVTAHSRSLKYTGPVYVKTPTGEVVPFVPGSTTAGATGSAASLTGGAAPAASTTGAPVSANPFPPSGTSSAKGPTVRPQLLVPGTTARYVNGLAAAPMEAPAAVQQIIWAGNQLIGLPYVWGGGHGSWIARGYDCSGTVSFALHAAGLLSTPEDSSELEGFGSHGIGRWVAVFGNAGHAYMTVAGLRLDTSSADDPSNQQGPRWRPLRSENSGFVVRHPLGL